MPDSKARATLLLALITGLSTHGAPDSVDTSRGDKFETFMRIRKDLSPLIEASNLIGQWRRVERAFESCIYANSIKTEHINDIGAIAIVLSRINKSNNRTQYNRRTFEQLYNKHLISPCASLNDITAGLGHYLKTFLTSDKYNLLLELCANLPLRIEFEKIYRQFKRRPNLSYPTHWH